MEIREAKSLSDYKLIEHLANIIGREHYTPIIGEDQVHYMLQKFQTAEVFESQVASGMTYKILWEEKTAIGYCAYEKRENILFLSKIYVEKSFRGKGIGKVTVQHIVDQAKTLGCNKIELTVNKNNTNSIAVYLKMGFRNVAAVVQDIGNGFVMDDYRMAFSLS